METQNKKGFDFKMDCKPDYGFVTVNIPSGQKLKVEGKGKIYLQTRNISGLASWVNRHL